MTEQLQIVNTDSLFKPLTDLKRISNPLTQNLFELDWKVVLGSPKVWTIGIAGGRSSGKTALGFTLMATQEKNKFIYNHPKPQLLLPFNIHSIPNFHRMVKLKDAFIWVDEPQFMFQEREYKQALMRFLSVAKHKNNIIVLSTSDTRWFEAQFESYIDAWAVKDIDYDGVKRGSKIKKIIKQNRAINPTDFELPVNKYFFYCRRFPELSREHSFNKPEGYTEALANAFVEMW